MSFIAQFGGNTETGRHTGLTAINKALASGMTINEVRSQLAREGIQTGYRATDFLAARPASSFVAQYGGNVDTMRNVGLTALNRARAAGLSLGQIRAQAAAEGISFGYRAQDVLDADAKNAQIQSITDSFRQQMDAMNRAREQELAQMQQQFKIENERMRREQEKRMMEQQKAAQVQMANAARAGVEGELKLGTERAGKGGVEAFKRRLKITPSTAQGLAISTANKPAGALNV